MRVSVKGLLSIMVSAFFAFFLATLLTWQGVTPWLSAIPFASGLFEGVPPTDLGVQEDQLRPCPATPNCVVSQNADASHAIEPLTYTGDRRSAQATLVKILGVVPRTQIVEQTEGYIRAESQSRLLGFVDDLEFYLPTDQPVIQVRSASRLGESDLGVNRRRVEQIRLALQDLETQP